MPIPRVLEVPRSIVSRFGLARQVVTLSVPGSEQAGVDLDPNFTLVNFSLRSPLTPTTPNRITRLPSAQARGGEGPRPWRLPARPFAGEPGPQAALNIAAGAPVPPSRRSSPGTSSRKRRPSTRGSCMRRPFSKAWVAAALSIAWGLGGCAHTDDGLRIRTGRVRFDATSVTSPDVTCTLERDGVWRGCGSYRLDGDRIENETKRPSLIRAYGYYTVERRPDGLVYRPSYAAPVWTLVTEDGQPIPANLEVPIFLAAQLGLSGQVVNLYVPRSDEAGVVLDPNCTLVNFALGDRLVSAWRALPGKSCAETRFVGRSSVAKLERLRGERWESPQRPLP